jgi:transcriptional regulator with XRE-family HTH domain
MREIRSCVICGIEVPPRYIFCPDCRASRNAGMSTEYTRRSREKRYGRPVDIIVEIDSNVVLKADYAMIRSGAATQTEMARIIGISLPRYNQLLRDAKTLPSVRVFERTAIKLMEATKIEKETLSGGANDGDAQPEPARVQPLRETMVRCGLGSHKSREFFRLKRIARHIHLPEEVRRGADKV